MAHVEVHSRNSWSWAWIEVVQYNVVQIYSTLQIAWSQVVGIGWHSISTCVNYLSTSWKFLKVFKHQSLLEPMEPLESINQYCNNNIDIINPWNLLE